MSRKNIFIERYIITYNELVNMKYNTCFNRKRDNLYDIIQVNNIDTFMSLNFNEAFY